MSKTGKHRSTRNEMLKFLEQELYNLNFYLGDNNNKEENKYIVEYYYNYNIKEEVNTSSFFVPILTLNCSSINDKYIELSLEHFHQTGYDEGDNKDALGSKLDSSKLETIRKAYQLLLNAAYELIRLFNIKFPDEKLYIK